MFVLDISAILPPILDGFNKSTQTVVSQPQKHGQQTMTAQDGWPFGPLMTMHETRETLE